jgi:signal transduction histidine kinase
MRSLQFRLLAAFALVILATITTVLFFINQATQSEIHQYEMRVAELRADRMQRDLGLYYLRQGSWEGIQPIIVQWGTVYEERLVLTDAGGIAVADSESTSTGKPFGSTADQTWRRRVLTLRPMMAPASLPIGTLYLSPPSATEASLSSLRILYSQVGRFFVWGGLVAIAIAILITFFLSRRALAPMKALGSAARLIVQGDFSQRVSVTDKGDMGELANAFNTMGDDLERLEGLRRDLVADIAHELRTPLSNLQGYLEAIRDGLVKPDTQTINSLHEEVSLLSRLVNDLQELALAEAGQLRLDLRSEDVGDMMERAVAAANAVAMAKGVSITTGLVGGLPRCKADSQRISQVLHNLLRNAVTHTPTGGAVAVSATARSGFVEIDVADTGEGIEAEELPKIFERFYRIDKSRSRSTGGYGLGLTIAKRIVEAHGGTIWATSTPGAGSRFGFTIPVYP